MDYGTLRVATPDGQIREYPITTPSVVIGRADGNQVVIDHVSVSRRHAQLTIESARISIEDLGSNTGTFVGGQRIPANTQTLVEAGQTLRFGDVEARFTLDPAIAGDSGPAARLTAAASGSETEQTIAVSIIAPTESLAPGSRANATVTITNRGTVTDELTLTIIDLPAEWIRLSRPSVSLVPGARDEITVNIFPPKNAASKAGEYTFAASVTSKVHGREVRALAKLTVLPFEEFRANMQPVNSPRDFKIVANNSSNVPLTVEIAPKDPEEKLDYQFTPTVELAAGEERTIPLAVKTKSRKLFGKSITHPFTVDIKPSGSLPPSTSKGNLQVNPPFERYRWPLVMVMLLGILGGGGLTYRSVCDSSWPMCTGRTIALPAGNNNTPTAVPSEAPTTAPEATATPTGIYTGGRAIVVNSDPNPPNNTNCLAVRSGNTPTISPDNVLDRLCSGAIVDVGDGPTESGNFIWWQVRGTGMSGNPVSGWAAERRIDGTSVPFLQPTP